MNIKDPIQRKARQIARAKEHRETTEPLQGVVVLFDVWRNESTGERRLQEIGRSAKGSYMAVLNVYANTHNPASQLLIFANDAEYEEVSAELAEDIVDPEWLKILFSQI